MAALQKELSEVETDIDDMVRGSPAWREKEKLLTSIPGIGPVTARVLLAEMPNWEASTAARSPRSAASPRGCASPANGRAGA